MDKPAAPTGRANQRALLLTGLLLVAAGSLALVAVLSQHARWVRGQVTQLPPPTLAYRPANTLGINVNLWQRSPAEREAVLLDIASAGLGWVRTEVSPSGLDAATLAELDAMVAEVHAANLQLWLVLVDPQPRNQVPNPTLVAQVAGELAERYVGQVAVYQIWDEPNLQAAWGANADPGGYLRLLEASANAIRQADPNATVLLAGLAPTVERGPANLSDLDYLAALYQAGGAAFFDGVSGKPYGFNTDPTDRTVDRQVLNFSRLIAIREVMVANGGENQLVWASHSGWNALPTDWTGAPSVWGAVDSAGQSERTLAAIARATSEWPWLAVLVLERYDGHGLAPDDARRGFALAGTPTWAALQARHHSPAAPPGNHPADTPFASYEGDWEFSDLGADIPQFGPAVITFTFEGTDLGIIARRDNYRAYLYVTVDGLPANALPRDDARQAVAVLTSGDYQPTVETVWLAQGLAPGQHTAVIVAERGWDQWAIVGFSVANVARQPLLGWLLVSLGLVAGLGLGLVVWQVRRSRVSLPQLPDALQFALTAGVAALFWLTAWLTWGSDISQAVRRYGDSLPLLVTLLTAGTFYFSPWMVLTFASVVVLAGLLYLRPAYALPLIAFAAPFYLQPRPLFERLFSVVEIVSLLAGVVMVLLWLTHWRAKRFTITRPFTLRPLDWAVLAFAAACTLSLLAAQNTAVAFTEFRVMVFEPLIVYGLLRSLPLTERDIWRTVDFWVLGGLVVAVIGLWQYVTGDNLITAEGGVLRLRSVFGSPNNVALYLGRLLPVCAAVALMGSGTGWRRWVYGGIGLVLGVAIGLTLSRGALLLGVPAALAVLILFWQGRRAWVALGGLAAVGLLALIPLSSNPRFAELLSRGTGPTFFRLNLWRSSLNMIADHPLTGVGLDNFLYAYRGRYIAPAAWQDPNLSHAHNWVLDFAARLGLPGLVAALAMIGLALHAGWQAIRQASTAGRRALAVGLVASMVNFMAHGLVDASYWFIDLAFAFMLTLGLLAWLQRPPHD